MNKVKILGVEISNMTNVETVNNIVQAIEDNRKKFIVTANAEILAYAHKNKRYLSILQKADTVTADGIGVVKGAKLLGHYIPERVTGVDLFFKLLTVANQQNFSIYLLGATEHVLNKTVKIIDQKYPNIQVAGSCHGFFDEKKEATVINEINAKKPDLIFVAMGAPLQEEWIAKHIHLFSKGVFIGVGGSFDVLSGYVKRAPLVWQKFHLEWFYRFLKNPSRWRRTMRLPLFVFHLLKQRQTSEHDIEQKEEQSL